MRTPAQVLADVCHRKGVAVIDARNPQDCKRTVVSVRRIVAYVLRVERGCSWGEVGQALGVTRQAAQRLCRYVGAKPSADLADYLGRDA